MNTILRHRVSAGIALIAALMFGSSCEDNLGLQVTPEAPYADKTLYEVITTDSELTDFVAVMNKCDIGGRSVADSLLNQSRVYTVWAPKNGTFNKDSLFDRVNKGYRDDVMKTFVEAHIANHLQPAKGVFDEDNHILLLNDKMALFEGSYKDGYKFGGQVLAESNIRVLNGMLHKLVTPTVYKYNIWEYLKASKHELGSLKIDSFANFLYSFDVKRFDQYQSIPGPIVDGVETYLDSVWVTSNKLLSVYGGIAPLAAEDSLYTIYVPTNDVWNRFMKTAKAHFNYPPISKVSQTLKMDSAYIDSLRHYYPRYNLIKYLAFSEKEQKYAGPDSIIPANRDVWERPGFPKKSLEDLVIKEYTKELSNGTFKVLYQYPYTIFDLWHDTIKIEGEDAAMRVAINNALRTSNRSVLKEDILPKYKGSELSGNSYFEAYSENPVDLTIKLPNVKSASYNVGLIMVPKDIKEEQTEKSMKNKLTVTINQDGQLYTKAALYPDCNRLDTFFLPDLNNSKERAVIKFKYCEYYNTYSKENFNAEIVINTSGLPEANDMSLRLDAILLCPVEDVK